MTIDTVSHLLLTVIFPPIIAILGIVGNISIIIIYSRKKFHTDPLRDQYRLLSFNDILCVLQILKHFLLDSYGINLSNNLVACKLISYASYFSAISAWIIVFISVDRMLSIIHRRASYFLRKKSVRTGACIIIVAFSLLFYSQGLVYWTFGMQKYYYVNTTISYELCDVFVSYDDLFRIFKWFDVAISSVIPFIFMIICSSILIGSIFKMRQSKKACYSLNEQKRVRKDIKFSVLILVMDLIFIALHLPICLFILLDSRDLFFYAIWDDLYYSAFAVNFFVFFLFNSKFKEEFLRMIGFQ